MTSNVPSDPVRVAGCPPHPEINKDVQELRWVKNYWPMFEINAHTIKTKRRNKPMAAVITNVCYNCSNIYVILDNCENKAITPTAIVEINANERIGVFLGLCVFVNFCVGVCV